MEWKKRFDKRLAGFITSFLGSMSCTYLFILIAVIGFPRESLCQTDNAHQLLCWLQSSFVPWLSQTFIQLVALSVLQVGTNLAMELSDRRQEETHALIESTHKAQLSEILEVKGLHEDFHTLLKKFKIKMDKES